MEKNRVETIKRWVARDMNGELFLYDDKPVYVDGVWMPTGSCGGMPLDDYIFPEFKNIKEAESMEVEIGINTNTST